MTGRLRIGELLVNAGLLTSAQLEAALESQRAQGTSGRRLGHVLVELGFVSETQLAKVLSQQLSVPWVSLHHIDFSRQLLNLVPRELAEEFCLVPVYVRHERKKGDTLYLAMDDPTHDEALRRVHASSGLPVKAMIAAPTDIRAAIRAFYGGESASAFGRPPASSLSTRLTDRASAEPPPPPSPVSAAVPTAQPTAAPVAAPADTATTSDSAPATRSDPSTSASAGAASFVRKTTNPGEPPPTTSAPPATNGTGTNAPTNAAAASSANTAGSTATTPTSDDPTARTRPPPGRRMMALTLLDGTTIRLPARRRRAFNDAADTPPSTDEGLNAQDLLAALRAVAHGADAEETLGELRAESILAALLTILLKKQLITERELLETLQKM